MKTGFTHLARAVLAPVAALTLLAGCARLFDQKGGQALDMAQEKEKEGDYAGAIRWYEASLDGTPRTAEAHYSMGLIYDDKLENPVAALDHFRRYLELAPDGKHAKDAQSFSSQDEFRLANTLSKGDFMPQQDAARLKNQNFQLQQELTEAKKDLADLRAEYRGVKIPEAGGERIPAGARTYTVESGDTLRSISRKFFNSPSHWQNIQDANYERLDGGVRLKVGTTLVIPRR